MIAIIITGINRGLGEALFNQLLKKENVFLIGVSRKFLPQQEAIEQQSPNIKLVKIDLASPELLHHFKPVEEICQQDKIEKIVFLNNAGIVTPIGAVGQLDPQEMQTSFQVNMIAPTILANSLAQNNKPLTIANISSGAADNTITGWSVYCGAKAGAKMFFEVMNTQSDQVEVVHINPGIMDTGMQVDIRNSASEGFPRLDDFKSFKEEGALKQPDQVAKDILQQLNL